MYFACRSYFLLSDPSTFKTEGSEMIRVLSLRHKAYENFRKVQFFKRFVPKKAIKMIFWVGVILPEIFLFFDKIRSAHE